MGIDLSYIRLSGRLTIFNFVFSKSTFFSPFHLSFLPDYDCYFVNFVKYALRFGFQCGGISFRSSCPLVLPLEIFLAGERICGYVRDILESWFASLSRVGKDKSEKVVYFLLVNFA